MTTEPSQSVDLFLKYNPDVVLLDLNMPDQDGFSVITDLKERCNDEYLPVIILTGEDDVSSKRNWKWKNLYHVEKL